MFLFNVQESTKFAFGTLAIVVEETFLGVDSLETHFTIIHVHLTLSNVCNYFTALFTFIIWFSCLLMLLISVHS